MHTCMDVKLKFLNFKISKTFVGSIVDIYNTYDELNVVMDIHLQCYKLYRENINISKCTGAPGRLKFARLCLIVPNEKSCQKVSIN